MSRFYGRVSAAGRTDATRRGHQSIAACADGWNLGGRVVASIDHDDEDQVELYATAGSNASRRDRLIATVRRCRDGAYAVSVIVDAQGAVFRQVIIPRELV